MAAVERPLRHRVDQAEGRHHCAGGQHLDLEVAAGHVVDLLRVVERELVEDVLRRPGALPAHRDRAGLALRDHRKAERRAGGGGAGRGLQELAAGMRFRCGIPAVPEHSICVSCFLQEDGAKAPSRGWLDFVTPLRCGGTDGPILRGVAAVFASVYPTLRSRPRSQPPIGQVRRRPATAGHGRPRTAITTCAVRATPAPACRCPRIRARRRPERRARAGSP